MTPSHFQIPDHLLEATTCGRPFVINSGLVTGNAHVLLVAPSRPRALQTYHGEVKVAGPDVAPNE